MDGGDEPPDEDEDDDPGGDPADSSWDDEAETSDGSPSPSAGDAFGAWSFPAIGSLSSSDWGFPGFPPPGLVLIHRGYLDAIEGIGKARAVHVEKYKDLEDPVTASLGHCEACRAVRRAISRPTTPSCIRKLQKALRLLRKL